MQRRQIVSTLSKTIVSGIIYAQCSDVSSHSFPCFWTEISRRGRRHVELVETVIGNASKTFITDKHIGGFEASVDNINLQKVN